VLSWAMISKCRLLEKLGPQRLFTRVCVERRFSEVRLLRVDVLWLS
jgi:hypothetical protein